MEHNTLGHSTIRHSRCELLLENSCSSTRCPKCEAHRKSLHAMLSRKKKESSSDQAKPSSHSNFRYLATPVKVNRLAQTHTLLRQKTQYIERLKLKIEKLQGVTMDSSTHDDLQAIVKENTTLIHEKYPPDTFQRLFWDQQEQAARVKDARSMRWHPLIYGEVVLVSSTCLGQSLRDLAAVWVYKTTLSTHAEGLHPFCFHHSWLLYRGRSAADGYRQHRALQGA